MARQMRHISFDEFVSNVRDIFDKVVNGRSIVVEGEEGELIVLKPTSKRIVSRQGKDAAYKAFLSASGSWDDVDVDGFNDAVRESRRKSSRPQVEL